MPGQDDDLPAPQAVKKHRVPLRSPRAWSCLLVGVALVGAGVGMMLDSGFGVSPGDVLFSGLAHATGWSVGAVVVVSYSVMVAVTFPVGVRPGPGTLACVLLIGPSVDLMRTAGASFEVTTWSAAALVGWWVCGFTLFTLGVVGLFAADLGVSPYDQLTKALAKMTSQSLGFARFAVDGTFFVAGVALGGSWGVGTVVLLLLVPLALNRVLPQVKRVVAR